LPHRTVQRDATAWHAPELHHIGIAPQLSRPRPEYPRRAAC
jgi:hypothetical protein